MKKKFKIAIPFAVLTLTCGISAGILTGCGHQHNFSDWKIEGDEHVKVCHDCGETDESTRGPHEFFGGICECGADENAGKVYSTASGQIKLHKLGGYETDYSGITIDIGDDDVQTELNTANGTFTITDAEVGKIYNLKISKAGYKDYETTLKVSEGKNTVIGGASGAVLEYVAFGLLNDYDGNYHDFSHVNEETPYFNFLENDGSKTLNVLSKDKYSDVSATMHLKFDNSTYYMHTQGIVLKFDDGKHVIVRYHNGDNGNGNIQYAANLWDLSVENTLFTEAPQRNQDGTIKKNDNNDVLWNDGWGWGEHKLRDLTDAEGKALKADGIDLNVILKDGAIHTFIGGAYIGSYTLPDGYADKKAQIGYFMFNTVSNAKVYYDIDENVPEELKCNLNINVTQPTDAGCTVNKSVESDVFDLTDKVELTFAAGTGYRLSELTVAGEDRYGDVVDGKLEIDTNRLNLDVEAVFSQIKDVALEITVKGNKLGETYNLAQGTQVQFENSPYTFVVDEDGKIKADSVTEGRYTVVVDGYFEQEINFIEGFNEVTLECDTFKDILGWGSSGINFDKQNAQTPQIGMSNDCWVVTTNEKYDAVTASIYVKGSDQVDNATIGILFRFVNTDGSSESMLLWLQNGKKVQFAKDHSFWSNFEGVPTKDWKMADGSDWQDLIFFEDTQDGKADANAQEYLKKYKAGTLKLTAIRDGATVYVYLDGRFIGKRTFDSKYANAECEVGYFGSDLDGSLNSVTKYWNVEITDGGTRAAAELTNDTADINGTVTLPTGEIKVGDTVQLSVAPNSGYLIKKLTVGGVDVTSTLTIDKTTKAGTCKVLIYGDASVVAEFEEIGYGSVESAVSINKLGTTTALEDGTEVTLSNSLFEYTTNVTEGNINLSQVAVGTYTVSVAGAVNGTIEITNEKYTSDIVLGYDLLKNIPMDWNWGDRVDLSKQNEGKITQTSGKTLWVATKDSYDNVSITVNVKNDITGRSGAMIKFGNEYVMVQLEYVSDDGNYKISWNADDGYGDGDKKWNVGITNITGSWDELGSGRLTTEEAASGETTVTLTRIGNVIYGSVNGVYNGVKLTLDETYANKQCQVGIYGTNVPEGAERQFTIVENAESPETTVTPDPAEPTDPTT